MDEPLSSKGPELRRCLEPMTPVAQHLHIAVNILATEGQRTHMVNVHPRCGAHLPEIGKPRNPIS